MQVQPIQNTRLNLRGRFLRLGEFKERFGCVDKLRHKRRALLRGNDSPVNQTVDELLGNALMHQILRRMSLATGFGDRHQQPRQSIRQLRLGSDLGDHISRQGHNGLWGEPVFQATQNRLVDLVQSLVF